MPLIDFEAAVDSCLTADEQGSEARLTPAEKSQAGLVGRYARVCGGLELSIAAQNAQRASDEAHGRAVEMARASTPATSVAAPTTTVAVPAVSKAAPTGRTVPMKDVVDIARSDEPPVMPQSEYMAFHATYKKWMHRAPPWDSEPTIEQISAVQVLVKEHAPPYVDLAIFGPHGQRTLRNLELHGLIPGENGASLRVERRGPPPIHAWCMCMEMFQVGGRWSRNPIRPNHRRLREECRRLQQSLRRRLLGPDLSGRRTIQA